MDTNFSQPAIFSEVSTPTAPDSGYLKVYAKSGALCSIANGASEKTYAALSDLSAYLPLSGGTLTGDLLFTDALYDIGKSGATRPRDLFASRYISGASGLSWYSSPYHARLAGGIDNVQMYLNGTGYWEQRYGLMTTAGIALNGSDLSASSYASITCGPSAGVLDIRGVGWPSSNAATTSQTLRLFNTYTSTTSFENLQLKANSGAAYQIGSAVGSAGGTNRAIDFGHWNAAGTFTSQLSLLTSGVLYSTNATSTAVLQTAGGNYIYGSFISTPHLSLNGWWGLTQTSSGGISFGSGHKLVWGSTTSNAPASGTSGDAGLARNAAGVVEINNGTIGTLRDLSCRAITTSSTIASPSLTPLILLQIWG